MKQELKQKLVNCGWDLQEIENTIGKNKMEQIIDCNIEHLYFNGYMMDAEGNVEKLFGGNN